MSTLPAPVSNYLLSITIADRFPAYLLVLKNGQLKEWGGHLERYGLSNLQASAANSQIYFLEGLLPLQETDLFLPNLKIDRGVCIDIYLFSGSEGDWVILLNATVDEQHRLLQQCQNELSLLQTQLFKNLSRIPKAVKLAGLPILTEGRQYLSILFADLRHLSYGEQPSSGMLFRTLNRYLHRIIDSIASEAGLINGLIGTEVMAYFGMQTAANSSAICAIQAALKILEAVQEINQFRQTEDQPGFEVGIGIASGQISLGLAADQPEQKLGIGYSVPLAAALQRQAQAGEILIDTNTFNQIEPMQHHFSTIDRAIGESAGLVQAYSFIRR